MKELPCALLGSTPNNSNSKQPIILSNCEVKKSRYGDEMEILLTKSTKICTSPRKFESVVSKPDLQFVTLDKINTLPDFTRVTVDIKVLSIDDKVEVKPQLFKQDVTIADSTCAAQLTVWQTDIDKIELDKSYQLQNVAVRTFDNKKYLTPVKSGFAIIEKEDIGATAEALPNTSNKLHEAQVIGVSSLEIYDECIACKSKVTATKETIGVCSKCSLAQHLEKCIKQLTVKLLIDSNEQRKSLLAFLSTVQMIVGTETLSPTSSAEDIITLLLMADPFSVQFSSKDIITAVYRE